MRPHYWNRWKADRITSQSVANIVVDWVWASGKHGITKVQALLGVKVDGIVGDKTLAALNAQPPRVLFDKIKAARVAFIEGIIAANPSQKRFRKGWLNRLMSDRRTPKKLHPLCSSRFPGLSRNPVFLPDSRSISFFPYYITRLALTRNLHSFPPRLFRSGRCKR